MLFGDGSVRGRALTPSVRLAAQFLCLASVRVGLLTMCSGLGTEPLPLAGPFVGPLPSPLPQPDREEGDGRSRDDRYEKTGRHDLLIPAPHTPTQLSAWKAARFAISFRRRPRSCPAA